MKITKNSYEELRFLYDDLEAYLAELKYDKLDFRMIAAEYATGGALTFFDSKKPQIQKDLLPSAGEHEKLLTHFRVSADALVESYVSSPASGATTISVGEGVAAKRQLCFIIFDFRDKITSLLYDFLSRYQKQILQLFQPRNLLSVRDIADTKQGLFNEAVKQYVDLDIISALAGMTYEKRDSTGSIIYIKNRRDADYKIRFSKEIDFSMANMRLLRKLLEMADSRLSLVIYEKKVVGLGSKDTDYRKVQFTGNHKWSLQLSQKEILRYSRGKVFFDRGNNQQTAAMPKGFILKKYEKPFATMINLLMKQKHGALLIISDFAKQEVDRLAGFGRGYAITPVDFQVQENLFLIKALSAIDGAVFIDRQLKCYGAGVILDGIAKSPGSSARGARYNSACCYMDNKTEGPYAAIIFSEDETMDIILNKFAATENLLTYKPPAHEPAEIVKSKRVEKV